MNLHIIIHHTLLAYLLISTAFLSCTETTITTKTSSQPLKKSPGKGIDIQKVMDYKMPHIIARYRKDYKVSEEIAKLHEIELKRFLILAGDDDDALGMMSTEVDNLWHTFLLFTKEYQAFCNEMFGKFIHHAPLVEEV